MTKQQTNLVGLIGRKGAGKDTVAAVLLERGFVNVKFAGGLKAMLAALLSYQGADQATIDRMIEGDLKEVPTDLLAGQTPRWAMQTLGDEWGRKLIGQDLWVDAAMKQAGTHPKAVLTDVRYPNECAAVNSAGGRVIRVTAVGAGRPTDTHASEAHIDQMPVDADFENDKSLGVDRARESFAALLEEMEGGAE